MTSNMTSNMANSATAISGVRRARLARGLTQDELARRAGLSRQALGAIEAAVYQPGVGAALALARELGASVEALFGRPEAPAADASRRCARARRRTARGAPAISPRHAPWR